MRSSWRFFLLPSLAFGVVSWNSCNQTQPVKQYNLVLSVDGADPNGFMLNALWGAQFNGRQGNNPGVGPVPLASPNEPWTSSQTDWDIGSDSGFFCGSHKNWMDVGGRLRAGTYTGYLTFESHSHAKPFDDDDYSFNLVPESLTTEDLKGAGLQAAEDHIHVEYDVSEVGDMLEPETPWWQAFHHAVDDSNVRPTPWDMLTSQPATVVGLMGMDTYHPPPPQGNSNGGETELHPIWAMAVRVKETPQKPEQVLTSADETYAFMARNWGNEGFCASAEWVLPVTSLSIKIPWRQGALRADISGQFNIVNPPDASNLPNNVSMKVVQGQGIWLTFELIPQPQWYTDQNGQVQQYPPDENGTVTEGELYIHWSGGIVSSPTAPPPPKSNGENTSGAEAAMQQLVAKMTSRQRSYFASATAPAKMPIAKHSFSAKLNPATQLTAPPATPQSAPAAQRIQSPRLEQLERSRMEALHAIFGPSIPGIEENPKVGPELKH